MFADSGMRQESQCSECQNKKLFSNYLFDLFIDVNLELFFHFIYLFVYLFTVFPLFTVCVIFGLLGIIEMWRTAIFR